MATAAALVGYNLYTSSNSQEFVSKRVGDLLEQEAKRNLETLADNQAAVVQSALEDNLVTARTMAKVFEVVREHMTRLAAKDGIPNPSRDILNDILHRVLENNPSFLGAYSAWEPDALDGASADQSEPPFFCRFSSFTALHRAPRQKSYYAPKVLSRLAETRSEGRIFPQGFYLTRNQFLTILFAL